MTTFSMKQGDTFAFNANIKDANGNPVIDSAGKIKSQIYNNNNILLGEFVITPTEVAGQYLFKILDTSAFPVGGVLFTDIQFTDSGVIVSSDTMTISVKKDVTE